MRTYPFHNNKMRTKTHKTQAAFLSKKHVWKKKKKISTMQRKNEEKPSELKYSTMCAMQVDYCYIIGGGVEVMFFGKLRRMFLL